MNLNSAFEREYNKLNKEQKEAVDSIDGPVIVVAGPGTGKTTVLTLRIANILKKTDTPPDAVLALTFTESAVYSMRKKLSELIGSLAYRVKIATFHGFSNEIIQNYPEYFPRIIGSNPASEITRIRIIQEIIEKNKFKLLKPLGQKFFYVKPISDAIRSLKKESYSPSSFKKWLKGNYGIEGQSNNDKIKRSQELARVFDIYEKTMRKRGLYDYEDMIIEVALALEKYDDLLSEIKENSLYILADEHQDANGGQNMILELLTRGEQMPNLFIVGDEKQAIYRFQGASLENFLYFKKKFPLAKVIMLTRNYRSVQEILDASHQITEKIPSFDDRDRPRLISLKKHGGPAVYVHSFENERDEFAFVAREIEKLSKDEKVSSIAVLYRNNEDAWPLARCLSGRGLNFSIRSDENILVDPDIKNFTDLIFSLSDLSNNEKLAEVLFFDFLNLPFLDTLKIIKNFSSTESKKYLIEGLKSKAFLEKAGVEDYGGYILLSHNLEKWARLGKNDFLVNFLDTLFEESGFKRRLLDNPNALNKLERLEGLYDMAKQIVEDKKDARIDDFVHYLKSAADFGIKLDSGKKLLSKDSIELMTAHRSKGLEFDIVFIVRAIDEKWKGRNGKNYFEMPLEAKNTLNYSEEVDERRLFYVALTRARQKVFITFSNKREDGREISMSRFIEDIPKDLLNFYQPQKDENQGDKIFERFLVRDNKTNYKTREYLVQGFLEEGFNVTAFNNYLECPWKYFFQNMIKMPQMPEKHQDFGKAIHYALRIFQKEFSAGKKVNEKHLIKIFKDNLRRYPLDKSELAVWQRKGELGLKNVFRYHNWVAKAIPEFVVDGIKLPLVLNGKQIEMRLKGRIDEIIFKENSRVSVLDFKTGRVKSRREILGETKSSNGDIWRQLLFYKLLVEEMNRGLVVDEGIIEFVEPDKSGRYRREVFNLLDVDTNSFQENLKIAIRSIISFDFLDKKCNNRSCSYCSMGEKVRLYL